MDNSDGQFPVQWHTVGTCTVLDSALYGGEQCGQFWSVPCTQHVTNSGVQLKSVELYSGVQRGTVLVSKNVQ